MSDDQLTCPSCKRVTPALELSENSGCCAFCKRSFRLAHKRWIDGTINTAEHEVVEFVDSSQSDHYSFDFSEIDSALGAIEDAPEDARAQAAELVRQLFAWIWSGRAPVHAAMVRFAALSAGLRPELLDHKSYREIGAQLNCTRQNLSKAAVQFQEAFRMKFARSRSERGRRNMSRAALDRAATHSSNEEGLRERIEGGNV